MFQFLKVRLQIRRLSSGDYRKRLVAASLLGELGDKRAVDPLLAVLERSVWFFRDGESDKGVDVARAGAAKALGKLGDPKAAPALVAAMLKGSFALAEAARSALLELHAVEQLTDLLDKSTGRERETVAGILGEMEDQRAVAPLIAALKAGEPDVRSAVARSLAALGDRSAVESLILALEDSDDAVRRAAAWALGALGDRRAVAALVTALNVGAPHKETVNSACAAAEALGKLGDRKAVTPLIQVLKTTENRCLKRQCCVALGELGDRSAIDALVHELNTAADGAREAEELKAATRQGLRSIGARVSGLALGIGDWLTDSEAEAKDVRRAAAAALEKLGRPQS
jgi:HEAT repeat protein